MKKLQAVTIAIGLPLVALAIVWGVSSIELVQAAPPARPPHAPGDCVVTTTADSGPGSLRQCILDLQTGATITFSTSVFPLASPATIALVSTLPDITMGNVTIDGSDAGVILDGSGAPEWTDGLVINGANRVVIKGLQILNFPNFGVNIHNGAQDNLIGGNNANPGGPCSGDCNLISGNGLDGVFITGNGTMNNTISGNYIGTDVNGTSVIPNTTGVGISDGAQYNTIGGTTPGERNVISGNTDPVYAAGVWITGVGTEHNVVIGNYIGTDASGTAALGNTSDPHVGGAGVTIQGNASRNIIGGDTVEEHNLISGNDGVGINIAFDASHNIVSGNYIGTDVSGTAALPNDGYGVQIGVGANNNIVGGNNASPDGACTGECNLISGNNSVGLTLEDSGTEYNIVSGNYIGTDVNGTSALPNSDNGVYIFENASYNLIGGGTPAERNLISGNEGGVSIGDGNCNHNTIIGNYIGTDVSGTNALGNTGDGVNIWGGASQNTVGAGNTIAFNGSDGGEVNGSNTLSNTITQNSIHSNAGLGIDLVDGGNTELPKPIITGYNLAAGTAAGSACANCTVELFSDKADEGQVYEGTTAADASGNWTFSKGSPLTGPHLTATATDTGGNTSELGEHSVYLPLIVKHAGTEVPFIIVAGGDTWPAGTPIAIQLQKHCDPPYDLYIGTGAPGSWAISDTIGTDYDTDPPPTCQRWVTYVIPPTFVGDYLIVSRKGSTDIAYTSITVEASSTLAIPATLNWGHLDFTPLPPLHVWQPIPSPPSPSE